MQGVAPHAIEYKDENAALNCGILRGPTTATVYNLSIDLYMRKICAGRTVLIIAHRLSTVRGCDRIVTIDRGRIVEDGTHEELLRSGGRYASLHRYQAGAEHAVA